MSMIERVRTIATYLAGVGLLAIILTIVQPKKPEVDRVFQMVGGALMLICVAVILLLKLIESRRQRSGNTAAFESRPVAVQGHTAKTSTALTIVLAIIVSAAFLGVCYIFLPPRGPSVDSEWVKAQTTDTASGYADFLEKHQGSKFASAAEAALKRTRFDFASRSSDPNALKTYIGLYPNDDDTKNARELLVKLEERIADEELAPLASDMVCLISGPNIRSVITDSGQPGPINGSYAGLRCCVRVSGAMKCKSVSNSGGRIVDSRIESAEFGPIVISGDTYVMKKGAQKKLRALAAITDTPAASTKTRRQVPN